MNTMQKVYMDAQAACGLKVGDYVRVVRQAESGEGGWGAFWKSKMNEYVGEIGRVKINNNEYGIGVEFDKKVWSFPYFVLEKVEKPAHQFKPFDKILVRDDETKIWLPAFFMRYENGDYKHRIICGTPFKYCIPYEGNEHLCGTSDPEE